MAYLIDSVLSLLYFKMSMLISIKYFLIFILIFYFNYQNVISYFFLIF